MKTISIRIIEKVIQAEIEEDFEEERLFEEILSIFNPKAYYIELKDCTYSKNPNDIPLRFPSYEETK